MSDVAVLETRKEAEEKATQIPNPSGYRILCMVPKIDGTYESGLIKAETTINVEQQITVVLYVVKLGPEAYKDEKKFPSGPWCKEGDFIITRAYAGTRVAVHGTEFRVLNDDSVEATVDDPRGIRLAGKSI
jgi:co-chaperonin GroES (HSP10)